MIRYALQCAAGHTFEGWFRDAVAFDDQEKQHLLACPSCGSTRVSKALMAPAIAVRAGAEPHEDHAIARGDRLREALRHLRAAVESSCDPVGDRFAEEALRRHRESVSAPVRKSRGIYGTMSDEDREILEDEGVNFVQIPWARRSDA